MSFKNLKLEFFYIRKAFGQYHRGFEYLFKRYFFAKKIVRVQPPFGKITDVPVFSINVLTCHRDLILTLWSLASFYQVMPLVGELIIHDDSSLTNKDVAILKRFFPSARIASTERFLKDYSTQLESVPTLKSFRTRYNNFSFKKIIDPYFVSRYKLVLILDSDILWFKTPGELVDAIKMDGAYSLMQKNRIAIYPALRDSMQFPEPLAWFNAGIIFYNKDNFNLAKLSEYFEMLDVDQPRSLHFADQLGHAYCLESLRGLPLTAYIIKGHVTEAVVAKHYTGPQRALFYLDGLRLVKDKIGL